MDGRCSYSRGAFVVADSLKADSMPHFDDIPQPVEGTWIADPRQAYNQSVEKHLI
jgi:hypothetical protein